MTEPAKGSPYAAAKRETLARTLQEAADHYADQIYYQDGVIHCPNSIETRFPDLDWPRLLNLYTDSPDDWKHIIANYLDGAAPEEPEDPAAAPLPPLRRIGTAPDFFTGQERPVYNRDPEPGEALPPLTPERE